MKTALHALTLLCFVVLTPSLVRAQAMPTASRIVTLSDFGGLTGTFTGLDGGRNLGITAGGDIGFRPFHGFYPSAEVRGTYPIDDGQVDSQKNIFNPSIMVNRLY